MVGSRWGGGTTVGRVEGGVGYLKGGAGRRGGAGVVL